MKKLAIVLFTVMIAACNTAPTKTNNNTPTQPENTPASAPAATNQGQAQEDNSVYFDFNKSTVKPEYNDLVSKEADLVKKGTKMTLQGNCDERGSAEYNLALGYRRAHAVKKLMVAAGAPAKDIKTISFGKEKPRALCHNESCWKQNRRVDFAQ